MRKRKSSSHLQSDLALRRREKPPRRHKIGYLTRTKAGRQAAPGDSARETRERRRRQYRPEDVRILFVGEAPPASGLFFYNENSGLYRAIRATFVKALPGFSEADFLTSFQSLGCYLVDLCGEPVDQMDVGPRKEICAHDESRLTETIRQLRPKLIVSVVRSIKKNVSHACKEANFEGQHVNLPYPGRWERHRIQFEQALTPILRREFGEAKL
jgi:hypothetical protein